MDVSITQQRIDPQGPVNIVKKLGYLQNNVTFNTFSEVSTVGQIRFGVRLPEIDFTGRSSELASLETFFQQSSVTKKFIFAVSGLGGIGKTQLIRKFIHDKQSYENVVWINSETIDLINESFKTLAADRLKIPTTNANGREKDSQSIIEEVLEKLCQKKSFFVYDNVETIESVKFILTLQSSGENPHIVITSRMQQLDDGIDVIQLKQWELNEAKMYVSSILKNLNDSDSDIELLVKMLQCFPLALRQATSYIKYQRKSKVFPISEFIFDFNLHTQEMLDSKTFQNNFTNLYKQTTLTAWSITFDAIQRDKASGPLAIQILNFMAYFAPDDIHRDFFRYHRCDYLDHEIEMDKQLISAVGLLINYSMVDSQELQSILSIHRLVQEVIKVKLCATNQEKEVLRNALTLVSKLINDAKDKTIHPHAVSVFLFALKFPDLVREFITLPSSILVNLKENGKYNQCKVFGDAILEPLSIILSKNDAVFLKIRFHTAAACILLGLDVHALQQNVDILKQQNSLLGEDHPDTVVTKCNVAYSNRALGNHMLALKLYKEVVQKMKSILGEDHPDTLRTMLNVAYSNRELGHHNLALQSFEEVFQKQKSTLGDDHPDTLISMSNIAFSNRNLGNHTLALQSYEKVFQTQKSILGEDHPDTLITMSHIARSNLELGNHTLALQLYDDVFRKQKSILGEEHPETLATMSNIAYSNRELGNHNLALQSFEEIFQKRMSILGEDHPDTLLNMSNIAFSHGELGNHTLALQLYENVFQKRMSILGEDHPDTLISMSNIAYSNRELGNHNLALQSYEELFQKRNSILGEEHPTTLKTKLSVALSNRKLGNHRLALQLFGEVLQKQKSILGENHPDTLISMFNTAVLNRELGNQTLALQLFEEVYEKQKSILAEDHPDTLITMSDIAISNREVGNHKLALQLFEELFLKQKYKLGEDHPYTLTTMSNIALTNKELGNYTSALQLYENVFQKQKFILGENHKDVLITVANIANLQLEMPINFFI